MNERKKNPICLNDTCKTRQTYMTGGKKGYCQTHGEIPRCIEKDCKSTQNYREGGDTINVPMYAHNYK